MAETVLVTGIGGFVGKYVALELLRAGYAVRGTVRSEDKAASVHATLKQTGCDTRKLSFVLADLTVDEGWDEAVAGCKFVQHVASPFPAEQPKDREGLVPVAKDGALRVLAAAMKAEVERVVMTSSIAAMMYRANRPMNYRFGEAAWTDTQWQPASAYVVSKTRAERAAWDFMEEHGVKDRLSVVNPGFVLGPALDKDIGTSLGVVAMMLKRKYPALPPLAIPTVDVRDVARVHLKAMDLKATAGRRLIAAADTVSLVEIAKHLKSQLGDNGRRVPTRELPAFLVRLFAKFDANLASITADLGVRPEADCGYVTELTGVTFRPAREAALASAKSLIELKIV